MRAVSHAVLAAVVVAAATTMPGGIRDVDTAAASQVLNLGIESIAPAPDDVVGVAAPIVVTFSKPVPNRLAAERDLAIRSVPAMTGRFEWLESDAVQWVPDRFWPAHSTVMLSVGNMRTQIQTGQALVGVADISDHTFTVTVDGVGVESSTGLPSPHHLPHAGEPGVLLASMGRPEYPTPTGTYPVLSKERSVLMDSSSVGIPVTASDGYLMEVDYAVRITRRGIFVHSAPWAVPSIGFDNVSHGCISLIPAAAEWYFDTVNVGDPVIVQE
jgi:lipoprotein-anchoring transpeptidase ErfK/SrfK